MGGRKYILRKIAGALLTLFLVLVFNFFLFRILPSDPVKFLTRGAGLQIDAEEQQELLREFGLDKPVWPITLSPLSIQANNQFFDYIGDTAPARFRVVADGAARAGRSSRSSSTSSGRRCCWSESPRSSRC